VRLDQDAVRGRRVNARRLPR
jgi:hypothetical protein